MVIAGAAYEAARWFARCGVRAANLAEARNAAAAAGKPLLVVGAPRAWYQPFPTSSPGHVTCDLNPTDPETERCDVLRLPYRDKQFGAVAVQYVLEMTEDPVQALSELYRVADHVFVAHLRPYEFGAWLHPGVRWVIVSAPPARDGIMAIRHPTGGSRAAVIAGIAGVSALLLPGPIAIAATVASVVIGGSLGAPRVPEQIAA